jgi:hypothetical protein
VSLYLPTVSPYLFQPPDIVQYQPPSFFTSVMLFSFANSHLSTWNVWLYFIYRQSLPNFCNRQTSMCEWSTPDNHNFECHNITLLAPLSLLISCKIMLRIAGPKT